MEQFLKYCSQKKIYTAFGVMGFNGNCVMGCGIITNNLMLVIIGSIFTFIGMFNYFYNLDKS